MMRSILGVDRLPLVGQLAQHGPRGAPKGRPAIGGNWDEEDNSKKRQGGRTETESLALAPHDNDNFLFASDCLYLRISIPDQI